MRIASGATFLLAGILTSAVATETRQDVISRMDQAAASFRDMTADIKRITHTAVLNEDDTDSGRAIMKKAGGSQIQGLVEFTKPDHKFYAFESRKLQIYTPNDNTVQVYDLGKHGEQLDRFLSIGFGTSGRDLARDYQITVGGPATINGQPTTRVELIPNVAEAKKYVNKIELWLTADGYPAQEKLYQPSGDYVQWNYSNVKINAPLAPDALQLKVAPGAKYEYPQK
jgi:outer membrane lipoprotein-sorting protein